jgi:hypothetical protein
VSANAPSEGRLPGKSEGSCKAMACTAGGAARPRDCCGAAAAMFGCCGTRSGVRYSSGREDCLGAVTWRGGGERRAAARGAAGALPLSQESQGRLL